MSGTPPAIDERRYKPPTIEAAQDLYDALVATGIPICVARGVLAWVLVVPERRADDPASAVIRSKYRKALGRVGTPPWERVRSNGRKGVEISSTEALPIFVRAFKPGLLMRPDEGQGDGRPLARSLLAA